MADLKESDRKRLEKTGFRFFGRHSATKTCEWTRKALTNTGICYKQQFYNVPSYRCLQMTPSFQFCTHRCLFCWRDISFTKSKWAGKADDPRDILDGLIEKRKELLRGFGGNDKTPAEKFKESLEPKQVAVSLAGEPTLYPKLPELIDLINGRGMTSFLVSNGTQPQMIKKLLVHQPTQLYLTLPAPDEIIYNKTCQPLLKDGWRRIMKSMSLLNKFTCNTVIRLTLVKDLNMLFPEKYGKLIKKFSPSFVEIKAFMSVGFSRQRLPYSSMPRHSEIKKFAEIVAKESGYSIIEEKVDSRVVLLRKK